MYELSGDYKEIDPVDWLHWALDSRDIIGNECFVWPWSKKRTGPVIALVSDREVDARDYMCERVTGQFPEHHRACMKCINPFDRCMNPNHIEWRVINWQEDVIRKPGAPLTEKEVIKIWEMLCKGWPKMVIAKSIGIGKSTVAHVRSGRNYSDITSKLQPLPPAHVLKKMQAEKYEAMERRLRKDMMPPAAMDRIRAAILTDKSFEDLRGYFQISKSSYYRLRKEILGDTK